MRRTIPVFLISLACSSGQPKVAADREAAMKADLAGQIDAMKKQAQVMVDCVFSFGELGFQEFETSKYLTGILEKEGFKIERGVAGNPDRVGGHVGDRQAGHLARFATSTTSRRLRRSPASAGTSR